MSSAQSPPKRSGTPQATKRLLHELHEFTDDSSPNPSILHMGPVADNDLMRWTAVLRGTPGTPYEDGQWLLSITLPPTYPLAPPTIIFETPIIHPNISLQNGEICLDLLKDAWSGAYTIEKTLGAIVLLLADPQPDSPLNVDVAALWRAGDVVGAEGLVRYWCGEYRYRERG